MRKLTYIAVLILLLANLNLKGQTSYGVQATPILTPPYTLKLSDYSKLGSQHLTVNITIADLNVGQIPVKLRIKMETPGITIENPKTINTTPIYVSGGSTTILFGNDLADYFNIDNLIFKGYSKEAYRRTGQLPDGLYRFTVEVLQFQTNNVLSNQGTATAWIALGKPPILKLPLDNTEMGQFKGIPLVFSWLPSNVGSPVSASSIQYKFELWEMRVAGVDPYVVATSIPVFHEATSFNTQYSLIPSSLMMEPGMKYAWRVTAFDAAGLLPFEQDGKSEIRTFTYKSKCEFNSTIKTEYRSSKARFVWEAEDNHTSYNVEMREPVSAWFSASETYDSKIELFEPTPEKTYEVRIQAVCNGDATSLSDFSEWAKLEIPAKKPLINTADCPECACEDDTSKGEIGNFELREDLQPGDTIVDRFGTTRYIVKSAVPQGDGTYRGVFLFWAEIWGLKFVCNYWDLSVNTDNVIVNMDFESVFNPQFLLDVGAAKDYLANLGNNINTVTTIAPINDTLHIAQEIATVYITPGDSVMAVVHTENGGLDTILISGSTEDSEKILLQDENGDGYVVTRKGDIMGKDEYLNTGGNTNRLDKHNKEKEEKDVSEHRETHFSVSENQKYGFDAYNEDKTAIQQFYPHLGNSTYRPAWKSIQSFGTDFVKVENTTGITFRDNMGIPVLLSGNQLTVKGSYDGSEGCVYAYQQLSDSTEKITGKLSIASYSKESFKVELVGVNGATPPPAASVKAKLDEVYKQAVVEWGVGDQLKVSGAVFENGNMRHGGSGPLSPYNADQKAIIAKFTAEEGLSPNTYYLFFVNGVENKSGDYAGYMPFQYQAGFIYGKPNLEVIAHELGHGVFNLRHTFDKPYIAEQRATKNLMDYTNGTELWKNQWNLIHSPTKMLFKWAQDEKGAEAFGRPGTRITTICDENILAKINEHRHFYTPCGKYIVDLDKLKGAVANRFYRNDDESEIAQGAINGIIYKGKQYYIGWKPSETEIEDVTAGFGANNTIVFDIKDISTDNRSDVIKVKTYPDSKNIEIGPDKLELVHECGNDKSICSDFKIISEYNDELVDKVVGQVDVALNNIFERSEKQPQKGDIRHFIGNASIKKAMNLMSVQSLEDKFHILRLETEKTVLVYFMDLPTNEQMDKVTLKNLADEVLSKSEVAKGKNVALVLVSHSNFESILWEEYDKSCVSTVIAQNQTIVTDIHLKGKGVYEQLINLFISIEKPFYNVNIYKTITKGLVWTTMESNGWVSGAHSIYALNFFENKYFEDVRKLTTEQSLIGFDNGTTDINDQINQTAATFKSQEITFAEFTALKEEERVGIRPDDPLWVSTDYSGVGEFREIYKSKENQELILVLIEKLSQEWDYVVKWQVLGDKHQLNKEHFYDEYDYWVVVDPIVYGAVDVAGLIPGVDYIADGAGLLYSIARQDGSNIATYSIAIGAPLAGAAVIKLTKKTFGVFATRGADGLYSFTVKHLDDIEEGDILIRKTLRRNKPSLDRALKNMDKAQMQKYLAKLEEATDALIKRLKRNKYYKKWDKADLDRLLKDFEDRPDILARFEENIALGKGWKKLLKENNSVSDILRKDVTVLDWVSKQGDDISNSTVNELITQLDKPIKETIEDAQGRLTFVLDRPGQSNKVVSLHTTSTGQIQTTTYSRAYNPDLNPNIDVPLSENKLVPDYMGTTYLHPLQDNEVVKIKLSGNRDTDFARAREKLEITIEEEDATNYVWHHMDDFEIINGEAYGTMQLVERNAHGGTGVTGMQHSGSAAQWRAYYGSGY